MVPARAVLGYDRSVRNGRPRPVRFPDRLYRANSSAGVENQSICIVPVIEHSLTGLRVPSNVCLSLVTAHDAKLPFAPAPFRFDVDPR